MRVKLCKDGVAYLDEAEYRRIHRIIDHEMREILDTWEPQKVAASNILSAIGVNPVESMVQGFTIIYRLGTHVSETRADTVSEAMELVESAARDLGFVRTMWSHPPDDDSVRYFQMSDDDYRVGLTGTIQRTT